MRIAQISPLYESVPPQCYGGTERVVFYLTEELVRRGHDVTLFASGDSNTSARLVPICPRALRSWSDSVDWLAHHVVLFERLQRRAEAFDILHFHIDYLHYPVTRREGWPAVTTLHGRLDIPDLQPIYDEYQDMPVVSISNSQRRPLPQAHWCGTVHHGLPRSLYALHEAPGRYLAFVGRVSREKRVDRAIAIAQRSGVPLKVAAKVDRVDRDYFNEEIRPLLDDPLVEFIGEIGDDEKEALLGGALALLFPIDWSEPFGLVMIEAMACGTPVIAWRGGSVPEVMVHGVTGFIVDTLEDAVAAVERVGGLSRARCRRVFEARFTADRMASDYLAVYEQILRARTDHLEGAVGAQTEPV